ncbi:MAG: PAS domain-containing sensor histidine kinase, partial [Acidimicrobiales bacterium]
AGQLTGFNGVDINGTSAFDLVHPDDAAMAAAGIAEAFATGSTSQPVKIRLRFADGLWHPTEIFVHNLIDNPSVGGLVVTVRDVTWREVHEAATRRSEARLRSMVENLSDVIVVLDSDLNVQYASPGIETLISAPAYTNLGESAFNDIHPDDLDRVQGEIEALLKAPDEVARFEMRLGGGEAGYRWVEVTGSNRLHDPNVDGIVCTLRDVSDRRAKGDELQQAYERERQAAIKLRELDRLKDEFLATVSHELRTPLTSIAGFTHMLIRGKVPPEQVQPILERVSRSAADMTSMIENLLDFSRLQAGRVEVKAEPLFLREAVHEVIDQLTHQLADHQVEVAIAECQITGDPSGFGHVLRNLLVNAAKYSDPGKLITV